jgi:hypothetical protein
MGALDRWSDGSGHRLRCGGLGRLGRRGTRGPRSWAIGAVCWGARAIARRGDNPVTRRLTPGLFASNPFDLEKPVTQSASKVAPRRRPHPSRGTASRPLPPATVGARGERSRSTSTGADHPSTSIAVARAVTPQVQSSPRPATTETPAPAVVSQHTTSSDVSAEPAGSSGRPAFGSDGLLGPGHSPDS